MARTKKIWVKFKSNSTVPADVLGAEKDEKMQACEPVSLPEKYALHVIGLQIAEKCDAPKKTGGAKKDPKADETLKEAQQAVTDAEGKLGGLEAGTDAHKAAEAELEEAKSRLADLTAS